MAERGEGTGTSGGSHSRTSVTPSYSGSSRIRNQSVNLIVEGGCGTRSPLPLRKRKFPVPDSSQGTKFTSEFQGESTIASVSSDYFNNVTSIAANSAASFVSVSKRRRVTSESSSNNQKDNNPFERKSLSSPSTKRRRRTSNLNLGESPSLVAKAFSSKSFSGTQESPTSRRSSRGSFHLGFYAEGEQQLFAAFRDHTSELKSKGLSPEVNISVEVESNRRDTPTRTNPTPKKTGAKGSSRVKRARQLASNKSEIGSSRVRKFKRSKKKMTERKPSWNGNEGKSLCKVKDLVDETESICIATDTSPRCTKQRVSRRHTLPGRSDLSPDMGVTLSKCVSVRNHDNHDPVNNVLDLSTEPRPSTSGMSANLEDNLSNSASSVLNQLMRRLPRKKKSISEQDLSQMENPASSSSSVEFKKADKLSASILKKHQEVKRRRSANLENQKKDGSFSDKVNEAQVLDMRTNVAERSSGVGIFKSYPLRNRVKLNDDGAPPISPNSGASGTGSNAVLLNNSFPQHASLNSDLSQHFHMNPSQSLSLPSSPSSPGVPFFDTFRRLRDSRRLSHEQNQGANPPGTKPAKDVKQSSAWKRGHAVRKSPISTKRGTRGKTNTGTNATNRQGSQHGGNPLSMQMTLTPGGTHLPMPPSSLSSVLTSTTASGLLPSSALSSLGAIGSGGTGVLGSTGHGSSASTGTSSMSVGGALGGLIGAPGDSESEENEMGRLEALLASRGLPPSLFGALGPRMQHILHRSVSSSISSKAQQLLVGLQATGDEGEQLQAVIEMCQLLVMGNEDTLAGFPIKQVTPALITLLNMEHNFDMMNHACRALTYMMEALPRSSAVVVDAVPAFLEKLQVIQCMDVAEQSLTALNMLSRKHSKAILQARGVSACLTYIDFFSSNAQRAALGITANCFQNLTTEEFHFASDALQILSSRLTTQGDKKCVESVCLAFSRLVDCFQSDPVKLQEIAGHGLLTNTQQLLVMSPPVLSSGTFIMVIRMLSLMCTHCPELAVTLLKNNISQTLCYLLTNSTEPPTEQVELVPRSPQELYEITCLIGELMPVLPSDGMFLIDSAILKPHVSTQETLVWQWQDDRGHWHNYNIGDSRVIELAHQSGEDEISLCLNGNSYTLDFHSMQQINDNTGTMRSILRRMVPSGTAGVPAVQLQSLDARAKCLKEDEELASTLIKSLFSLLYEVYSSSAGPAVRYKCLRALLRMVHFCFPDLLQQVLKSQAVSSHLATMLSSLDLKIIVSALQMADLLMQKLPHIFSIYFRREGVMHQIKRLRETDIMPAVSVSTVSTPRNKSSISSVYDCSLNSLLPLGNNSPNTINISASPIMPLGSSSSNGDSISGEAASSTPVVSPSVMADLNNANPITTTGANNSLNNTEEEKLNNSSQIRFTDVLKRKRSKAIARTTSAGSWRRAARQEDPSPSPTFSEFLIRNTGFTGNRDTWRGIGSGRSKAIGGSSTTSGGSSSSGGGSKTAASFLSNFNPVRWGRCNSNPTPPNDVSLTKEKSGNINSSSTSSTYSSPVISSQSNNSANRDYMRNWIREQAKRLTDQYFSSESQGLSHPALTVMNRLIGAIQLLDNDPESAVLALSDISEIVRESDISPFEVIHSGLVRALLNYLTAPDGGKPPPPIPPSSSILSSFNAGESLLGVLAAAASMGSGDNGGQGSTQTDVQVSSKAAKIPRDQRLRNFLHVFLGCSLDSLSVAGIDPSRTGVFSALIAKLNGCVNQLEQFPVKVHDLPGSVLTGSGRGGSTSAIKFFNTHQLKCNLQRHPDCSRLKQWRGGPVKVDPLALVQAIERYLVIRGYGRLRDDDEDNSEEDNSDEDIDDTLAAVSVSHSSTNHKLQFLIGDHVLPYNMTVYQAIRQFASSDASASEADTDSEIPISHSSIWLQTHTIYYRPIQDDLTKPQSSRKGKASSKPSPKKKGGDASPPLCSVLGGSNCVLEAQLSNHLPISVTVKDPSLEVITLLRVLYALNRHYGSLYPPTASPVPVTLSEFVNMKLAAKANRQLQDPLVIMTGNLPQWLPQISYSCPFLFPFETRQLLFYAVSFDRDRALQRLMDSAPELNSSDSSERVTPRLERRKRTVSRDDILKQAETVVADMTSSPSSSRAMLEIQYENEVGTGLGPTLEFYALVSRELQKADLELWRGDTVTLDEGTSDLSVKAVKYVAASNGLYPLPLAKNTKSAVVTKVKNKFKFLGKFMAKAVMDSRMLDLNLHECVYKWLLSEEKSLGLKDVISMDPSLGQTLSKLQNVLLKKKKLQDDAEKNGVNGQQLQESIENLTVDGCKVEDLCLNFTLPGYPNIDLKKGGSDIEVTINNIEQYLQLVVEWLVKDGVYRQMEALREGFESVFPVTQLQVFYPEELEQLFCGSIDSSQWDMKQLAECSRPDHGYSHNSKAVKFLLQVLSDYSPSSQRSFLQFVTGSPRLPVGGFKSLSPPLTIVRKTFDAGENPDNFLPSVMTCVNYLKLPDYSTIEIMKEKLQVAYMEGQHSFHLS